MFHENFQYEIEINTFMCKILYQVYVIITNSLFGITYKVSFDYSLICEI